ncbi:MAG: NPCBM/NEW2 domain-containing protein [Planctomycetes bacterium]|nr:NPCBM/NEW2 domain-containing protein [Planctomycetota bacterium]
MPRPAIHAALFCLALVASFALSAGAAGEAPRAPRVRCLKVALGRLEGRLAAMDAERITLIQDGKRRTFPAAEFREIRFPDAAAQPLLPNFKVWTHAGGELIAHGVTRGDKPETVNLVGYDWHAEGLPLTSIRAVATRRFLTAAGPEEEDRFRQARRKADPARDSLRIRRQGQLSTVRAIVADISERGVALVAEGDRQVTPWDKIEWILLSPAGYSPAREAGAHKIRLARGSRLNADSVTFAGERFAARNGPASYFIRADAVASIIVPSKACIYLSDLEPVGVVREPFFDVVWQPQLDSSALGGPVMLRGRRYEKGIGMHARTRMTFDVPTGYTRFFAAVGIDDAAGGRGCVTFRVLAGDNELANTGPLSGASALREINLGVEGVERITLEADFGGAVRSSGNLADWADARFVKCPGEGNASPQAIVPSP